MALYKRTRSTRLLMVGLVTASLVTITVDFRGGESGPLDAAGRVMLNVIAPMQRAVSHVLDPVGNFFSTLGKLGSLRAENEQLRQQLAELTADRGTLLTAQQRIKELEELLDVKGRVGGQTVTGLVIAIGVSNFEWTVTVNVGSSDGVRQDMPVVAPEGLVGRVTRVGSGSSIVQLIIDPDSGVAARLTTSRQTGILEGQRDGDLRMAFVDPSVKVQPGELVETSGYENGLYPPGIAIGVVSRVIDDPAALSKEIWVRPNVDFRNLELVTVLLGSS